VDKYAKQFADAMERKGMRNTTVAAYLGGMVTPNNVSHWRTGRRGIAKDHAHALAILLDVPAERISKVYDQELRATTALAAMAAHGARTGVAAEGYVAIDLLEGFSGTDGANRIVLPEWLVRRELGAIPIEHLRWALQPSRAMEPDIKRHALVLVDTRIQQDSQVVDGGLYAFSLWGHPDIRRLRIGKDGWTLLANSSDVERMRVTQAERASFRLFGEIVGCL
jgi:Peptidase S24-like